MNRYERIAEEMVDESPRSKAATAIEQFLDRMHLNSPYLDSGMSKDKKYRYIIFAKPRTVDGEVRVYNPKFIMVSWQTAFRNLPHQDRRIFGDVKDAMEFIKAAFVDLDEEAAFRVPHRASVKTAGGEEFWQLDELNDASQFIKMRIDDADEILQKERRLFKKFKVLFPKAIQLTRLMEEADKAVLDLKDSILQEMNLAGHKQVPVPVAAGKKE